MFANNTLPVPGGPSIIHRIHNHYGEKTTTDKIMVNN